MRFLFGEATKKANELPAAGDATRSKLADVMRKCLNFGG
jgi:hypothetical protein